MPKQLVEFDYKCLHITERTNSIIKLDLRENSFMYSTELGFASHVLYIIISVEHLFSPSEEATGVG